MSREGDAALVAHINRLQSIARTAADNPITSYRRRAPTERELEDVALDPTRTLDLGWEPVEHPAGNEAVVLAALLRSFPRPEDLGGGRGR